MLQFLIFLFFKNLGTWYFSFSATIILHGLYSYVYCFFLVLNFFSFFHFLSLLLSFLFFFFGTWFSFSFLFSFILVFLQHFFFVSFSKARARTVLAAAGAWWFRLLWSLILPLSKPNSTCWLYEDIFSQWAGCVTVLLLGKSCGEGKPWRSRKVCAERSSDFYVRSLRSANLEGSKRFRLSNPLSLYIYNPCGTSSFDSGLSMWSGDGSSPFFYYPVRGFFSRCSILITYKRKCSVRFSSQLSK